MLDGLKPYSEYKDSGQPWLGAVPAHWHIERLDRLFRLRSEWPVEGDQRITGYLDGRVTLRSNVAGQKIKGVVKEAGWQRVHPGDFAISGMNAHLGGMGVSDSLGKCSPIYLVLIPKAATNAAFVSRAVRHIAHSDALKVLVSTIRFNSADFKRDHLKLIWVQVPPPAEQAGIVRFLGAVDRKVNRFIRAKRRLIEVLTEQKQAIITHAVTKGLNPHASLKPYGIEWLIPEHWEMLRAKYLFREVDERSLTGTEKHLSMSQRHGLVESDTMDERRLLSESYIGGKLCREGDLVLNRLKAHLGVFAVAPEPGVISPDYTVLRPLPRANVFFYELLLRSNKCRPELRRRAKGIVQGFWRLYTDDFYDIRLPVPSLTEQAQIVAACESSTLEVNRVIETTLREIDLIREYRTRLVADVVTGKVDVRAAAASLPDEPSTPVGEEFSPTEGDDTGAEVDTEDPVESSEEIEA